MEVWRTDTNQFEDDDLPGSCYFHDETFEYNGNRVGIGWEEYIPNYGLNIDLYYDSTSYGSWVYFVTPN
jgi:hypothetical protein